MEKLKAVGIRNKASAAEDLAKMRKAEDHSLIAEKQRELEVREFDIFKFRQRFEPQQCVKTNRRT